MYQALHLNGINSGREFMPFKCKAQKNLCNFTFKSFISFLFKRLIVIVILSHCLSQSIELDVKIDRNSVEFLFKTEPKTNNGT